MLSRAIIIIVYITLFYHFMITPETRHSRGLILHDKGDLLIYDLTSRIDEQLFYPLI